MEDKKTLRNRCKDGWRRHKKKLLLAGGATIGLVCGYYLVRHREAFTEQVSRLFEKQNVQAITSEVVEKMPDTINEPASFVNTTREVKVKPHVMNLPKGRVASEAAKAFAAECDFELGEGQTARHGYTKTLAA